MTGPEKLSIGGVSFYKSDVKSYEVQNEGNSSLNTVFMKDGTKIVFSDHNPKNKASIMMGTDSGSKRKGIQFSNVNLRSLEGTDNKDYYYMLDSSSLNIDISRDYGNADIVKFSYTDDSKNGLVPPLGYTDEDDRIIELNRSKDFFNQSDGRFYRNDEK